MDFIIEYKIFVYLGFLTILILWKFWKDTVFYENISKKIDNLSEAHANNTKEFETIIIEIDENSKKIEALNAYLKRLDQNASRLADNIQGEQAMSKAIDMARKGMDHLDIMKETGLSNEEVEAIIHSHKE